MKFFSLSTVICLALFAAACKRSTTSITPVILPPKDSTTTVDPLTFLPNNFAGYKTYMTYSPISGSHGVLEDLKLHLEYKPENNLIIFNESGSNERLLQILSNTQQANSMKISFVEKGNNKNCSGGYIEYYMRKDSVHIYEHSHCGQAGFENNFQGVTIK